MARCSSISNLSVHYKSVSGGEDLDNTIVLCRKCLEAALKRVRHSRGEPPEFDDIIKLQALSRAGYKCECTREDGCH